MTSILQQAPVRAAGGWPYFADDEIAAATAVLASGRVNYWTGEHGRAFESEFAAWVGAPYGVALANGTIALELALAALEIGPGDEVIVPATTFIATASAVAARGAVPVVADVSADRQSLTAETVEAALTSRTRAVIVVHLGGMPAEIIPILDLAKRYALRVVEDCAQAHGARLSGRRIGTFGDIAAWSSCQDKIMTTAGEGGAITTADPDLWRHCWELKDHGKDHDAVNALNPVSGFRWVHARFGTNARMTEVQAAVGRRQLTKLDSWVEQRRAHARVLQAELTETAGLRLPPVLEDVEPSWYRFYLHVQPETLRPSWNRNRIVDALTSKGVRCSHGGCTEIYRERAFDRIWPAGDELPTAAELGRTSIALLVHPTLSEADVRRTAVAVKEVMSAAVQ